MKNDSFEQSHRAKKSKKGDFWDCLMFFMLQNI